MRIRKTITKGEVHHPNCISIRLPTEWQCNCGTKYMKNWNNGEKIEIPVITKHGEVGYLCKCGCGRVSDAPINCQNYLKGVISYP